MKSTTTLFLAFILGLSLAHSRMLCLAASPAANVSTPAQERISWGKTFHGLQGGLSFPGKAARFRSGETVPLNLYWRNVTHAPITLSYVRFPDFGFYPGVRTRSGHAISLRAEPVLGLEETTTLEPGQTLCIAHPVMVIVAHPDDRLLPVRPEYALLPGRYVVQVGGNEKDTLVPRSGSLEFTVEEK